MKRKEHKRRLREEAYQHARAQPRDECMCGAWSSSECGCGKYVDYRELMIDYLIAKLTGPKR